MVRYDLFKKVPNIFDLRAYLFQLIASDLNFAEEFITLLERDYSITGDLKEIDLNLLSRVQLVSLLESKNVMPDYLLYFNRKDGYILTDYKHYPELFTSIEQLSFEEDSDEGLVVLGKFCRQVYELFTNSGKCLLGECSDLNLGAHGLIEYRECDSSGFWHYDRIVAGEFSKDSLKEYLSFPVIQFPNIFDRDVIALTNIGVEPKYEEFDLWQGDDYKITEILEDDGCMIRYIGDLRDNEEFAFTACKQNYLAFSLISQRLRMDLNFIKSILVFSTNNECIFRFLNADLQRNVEIIKLVMIHSPGSLRDSNTSVLSIDEIVEILKINVEAYEYLPLNLRENETIKLAYFDKKKEQLGIDGFQKFMDEQNSLPW